jgi:hypothetical protein
LNEPMFLDFEISALCSDTIQYRLGQSNAFIRGVQRMGVPSEEK